MAKLNPSYTINTNTVPTMGVDYGSDSRGYGNIGYSVSSLNRVTLQLNAQEITPEIVSDPETRKQKIQLVIRNGLTVITLESPVEIENMRNLAKTLSDWADAIEQSEATNTLTGNG